MTTRIRKNNRRKIHRNLIRISRSISIRSPIPSMFHQFTPSPYLSSESLSSSSQSGQYPTIYSLLPYGPTPALPIFPSYQWRPQRGASLTPMNTSRNRTRMTRNNTTTKIYPPVSTSYYQNFVIKVFRLIWYMTLIAGGRKGKNDHNQYEKPVVPLYLPLASLSQCIYAIMTVQKPQYPSSHISSVAVPHLFWHCLHLPVSQLLLYLFPYIYTTMINVFPSWIPDTKIPPALIVPCILLSPTFIVCCHRLKPMMLPPPISTRSIHLLVQSNLSDLIISLLFTLLGHHWFIWSSLLLSLHSNILTPLLSSILTPIFLPLSDIISLLQHVTFFSTCLHSAPIRYYLITPINSVWYDLLYLSPLF